jgi:hypothetical protein
MKVTKFRLTPSYSALTVVDSPQGRRETTKPRLGRRQLERELCVWPARRSARRRGATDMCCGGHVSRCQYRPGIRRKVSGPGERLASYEPLT